MTYLSTRRLGQASHDAPHDHPEFTSGGAPPLSWGDFVRELNDYNDMEQLGAKINNGYQLMWRSMRCAQIPLDDPAAKQLDTHMAQWWIFYTDYRKALVKRDFLMPFGYGLLWGPDWQELMVGWSKQLQDDVALVRDAGGANFDNCFHGYEPYIPPIPTDPKPWWVQPAITVGMIVGVGYAVGKTAQLVGAFRPRKS